MAVALVGACGSSHGSPDAPVDADDVVYPFLPYAGAASPGMPSASQASVSTEIAGYSYEGTASARDTSVAITLVDEDTQQSDSFVVKLGYGLDSTFYGLFSIEVADGAPPDVVVCRGSSPCWGTAHHRGARVRVETASSVTPIGEIILGNPDVPLGALSCYSREDVCSTNPVPAGTYGCVPAICDCPASTTNLGVDPSKCSDERYPHVCGC